MTVMMMLYAYVNLTTVINTQVRVITSLFHHILFRDNTDRYDDMAIVTERDNTDTYSNMNVVTKHDNTDRYGDVDIVTRRIGMVI